MTTPSLTTEDVAGHLERADIILTRGQGLVAWLIRWATRSYWNHVAVIFVLGDQASGRSQGYRRTFIIESEANGVDIHPFDKYLCNEKQDLVILRLPVDALPAGLMPDFLRRIRGFALDEIDADYGFSAIGGIIRRLFGRVASPMAAVAASGKLLFRTAGAPGVVNSWICSGVVQYAYYRSCFGADPGAGFWDGYFGEASHRAKLVFNLPVRAAVENALGYDEAIVRLKLTTPAHFALAAGYEQLSVVGERINGTWSTKLTRP